MAEPASDAKTTPASAPAAEGEAVLTPAFMRFLDDALEEGDIAVVKAMVDPLHVADFGALLTTMEPSQRRKLVTMLGADIDPEVLSEVDEDLRTELVRMLGSKTVAEAVKELDTEDAAYVLEDLEDSEKREVLAQVPIEDRAEVLDALLFPEELAGRLMHREFVSLPGVVTVAEAMARLTGADTPDDFQEIYLVDQDERPTGFVALSRLLRASPTAKLSEIASSELTVIPAVTDQKTFAYLFEHYHLNSAPVTDDEGRLVGVLSAGSVVEILQEMHQSEVLALGGVPDEESLTAPIAKTTRLRFSWLFVNLLTAMMASIVIGFFEDSLQRLVALAVLMPIVASMGGNAGTQTLTIVVRALATKELNPANLWRVINRELLIGALNGIGFAVIAAGVTWVWFRDPWLAGVIGAAMTINLIAAAFAGILVPVGLNRAGVDPAVSSPVFVTTVTDVVGFFSFLGLATWISAAVKFWLPIAIVTSLALAASAQAAGWSASERLETARAGLAAASANDTVYVGGGAGPGDPSNAFDMFDTTKEVWRPLPALPKGLMNFAMAASDKYVFIAGGFAADAPGEPRKDVWAYDIDGASWQKRSPLPHARAGHAMVQVGGRIYVVGGAGPSADKTLIYDPLADKWQVASGLGVSRRALAAATDGKRIYAIGGIKTDGAVSNAVEMFDPGAGTWTALPSMPTARGALTAGVIKGQLHVAGGATVTPLKTFALHDVFDLGSRTWSRAAPMPTARQALASGVGGGRWWVIGGGSGAGVFGVFTASDAVEGYEP